MPGVGGVHQRERPMRRPQSEKRLHLRRRLGRIANQQRLPLPFKPERLVQTLFVDVVIQLLRGRSRLGVHHECDLRRLSPLPPDVGEDLAQAVICGGIRGGVGGIEDEHVNARVAEEPGMPPKHPRIVALVIAKERLTPEMSIFFRPPERGVWMLQRSGSAASIFETSGGPPPGIGTTRS